MFSLFSITRMDNKVFLVLSFLLYIVMFSFFGTFIFVTESILNANWDYNEGMKQKLGFDLYVKNQNGDYHEALQVLSDTGGLHAEKIAAFTPYFKANAAVPPGFDKSYYRNITIFAFNEDYYALDHDFSKSLQFIKGSFPAEKNAVAIGKDFAFNQRLRVDDTFVVLSKGDTYYLTVSGIFETGSYTYDSSYMYGVFQNPLWESREYDGIGIIVKNRQEIKNIKMSLTYAQEDTRYDITTFEEENYLEGTFEMIKFPVRLLVLAGSVIFSGFLLFLGILLIISSSKKHAFLPFAGGVILINILLNIAAFAAAAGCGYACIVLLKNGLISNIQGFNLLGPHMMFSWRPLGLFWGFYLFVLVSGPIVGVLSLIRRE